MRQGPSIKDIADLVYTLAIGCPWPQAWLIETVKSDAARQEGRTYIWAHAYAKNNRWLGAYIVCYERA
jgi:hypothetical protein